MSVELLTESRPKADHATVKLWLARTRELVALAYEQPMPPSTQHVEWMDAPWQKWWVRRNYLYRGQERMVSCHFDLPQTDEGQAEAVRLFDSDEYQQSIIHAVRGWMARVDNPELFQSL